MVNTLQPGEYYSSVVTNTAPPLHLSEVTRMALPINPVIPPASPEAPPAELAEPAQHETNHLRLLRSVAAAVAVGAAAVWIALMPPEDHSRVPEQFPHSDTRDR